MADHTDDPPYTIHRRILGMNIYFFRVIVVSVVLITLTSCTIGEKSNFTTISVSVVDINGNPLPFTKVHMWNRNWTGGYTEDDSTTDGQGQIAYSVTRHDSEPPLAEWHEFRVEREGYYSQVQIAIPTQERVDVIFVLAPRSGDNVLGRPPK